MGVPYHASSVPHFPIQLMSMLNVHGLALEECRLFPGSVVNGPFGARPTEAGVLSGRDEPSKLSTAMPSNWGDFHLDTNAEQHYRVVDACAILRA